MVILYFSTMVYILYESGVVSKVSIPEESKTVISGEVLFHFKNLKCRIYTICGVLQTPTTTL